MKTKQMRLSTAVVDAITPPKSGRQVFKDKYTTGLYLVVGQKRKSWELKGRDKRKVIGYHPLMTHEQARAAALGWQLAPSQQAHGAIINPKPLADTPTLSEALDMYIEARKLSPTTVKDMYDKVGRSFAKFMDRPFTDLTPDNVYDWMKRLTQTGKGTAQKGAGRYLRAVARWLSVALDRPDIVDPTEKARRLLGEGLGTQAAHRVIPLEAMPKVIKAIQGAPELYRTLLMVYLLTGIRKSEGTRLTHESVVSHAPGVDAIQLGKTKNGKAHTVYIDASLGKTLRGLLSHDKPNDTMLRRHLENVREKSGVEFSLHDMRRSLATHASAAGIDMPVLKAMLNHTPGGGVTEKHYIKVSEGSKVEGFRKIAELYLWEGEVSAQRYV